MKKILLVEDDLLFRRSLKKMLNEYGVDVVEASDGAEGVEKCVSENLNIIVTDYMLPDMDGISMVNSLKRNNSKIKAILITAFDEEEIEKRARASGFIDFMNKPVDIVKLELLINRLIKDQL